jgi:hypothetical protein
VDLVDGDPVGIELRLLGVEVDDGLGRTGRDEVDDTGVDGQTHWWLLSAGRNTPPTYLKPLSEPVSDNIEVRAVRSGRAGVSNLGSEDHQRSPSSNEDPSTESNSTNQRATQHNDEHNRARQPGIGQV